MKHVPTLEVAAEGKAILVVLDLDSARQQWTGAAWTMVEDHLVRVLLSTMAKRSSMLIRAVLDPEYRKLSLSFQYSRLRVDFAQALFGVFADFKVGPIILGSISIEPGVRGLFAAFDGTPTVLVQELEGKPAIRQLVIDERGASEAYVVVPDVNPLPFSLKQAIDLGDGDCALTNDRTVMLVPALLVER